MNLSISLDPAIELQSENLEACYPGAEQATLLKHGSEWIADLRTKKKRLLKRNFKVFGENLDGNSILLSRYLTPLAPPADLFERADPEGGVPLVNTMIKKDRFAIEKVARFVSLLPFIEDLSMFAQSDMPDLYSTCQEFLDLGGGDYEEHAILLACMFKYIDEVKDPGLFESYLVFGSAMPMGDTVYVMRKNLKPIRKPDGTVSDTGSVELWAPLTGECYFFNRKESTDTFMCVPFGRDTYMEIRMNDPLCPLKHIYSIAGPSNLYANIQKYDFPVVMDFDLGKKKKWKPLFETSQKLNSFFPGGKIPTI